MQEVIKINDAFSQLSNLSLTGFTRDNTDELRLYASVKQVTDTRTVTLYRHASRSTGFGVASGFITEPSGEVTLTEQNSSGISGNVYLDYVQDDDGIEFLLGYATLADLQVYEGTIDQLLPDGQADFRPQHNEAFFRINRIVRRRLLDEFGLDDAEDLLDVVADKRVLTRMQVCYVLHLVYNDRAARLGDPEGVYSLARDMYLARFEKALRELVLDVDTDGDAAVNETSRPGGIAIGRA